MLEKNYYPRNYGIMTKNTDRSTSIDLRDALFDAVHEMASKDSNVIFITADMGSWSLTRFREHIPKQFINIGISEQNMIGVAAGLALEGKRVFVYAIIPFLVLRCLEQIRVDLCMMNLSVTLIGGGPGLCYASDGPTHHAIEDVSIMRALPGMTIYNPCDQYAAQAAIRQAFDHHGPVYIRLDKGKYDTIHKPDAAFEEGVISVKSGTDLLIISTGVMTQQAIKIAKMLRPVICNVGIADLFRIAPLPCQKLLELIKKSKHVATVEEHVITGGIGSAISELRADNNLNIPVRRVGIADAYCSQYGCREWMRKSIGLDDVSITNNIIKWIRGGE